MSSYVRKIKAGRIGSLNVTSSDYVGETGTIFYDESIGDLRVSDGVTPGGIPINTGNGGGSINGLTSNSVDTITLNSGYNFVPSSNGLQDLGSPSQQWGSLYVSQNTIYINNIPVTVSNNTLVVGDQGNQNTVATETYVQDLIANIPAGPQGNVGPQGPQGIQGNVGPQGDPGAPGTTLSGWTVDASNHLIPNTDNLQDIGTPSLRVRHIYVGPGSISVGNSVITESGTGKLVLPGLTRGTGFSVNEVEDTDDQIHDFNGVVPLIIDNAHFAILNGANGPGGYVPPEYSVDQLDGDGFIDGISVDSQGSGLTQTEVDLMRYNMWAYVGSDNDPIGNWNSSDWISIPFRVRCEASDVEYEFNTGGGFTLPPDTTFDDFYEDGGATIYNSGGKIQLYSLVSDGNDGVNIRVKGDGGDSTWEFKSDGNLTLPLGGDIKDSNGNSVLGGAGLEIDGGNASTIYTAEIEIDGGEA